MKKNTFKEGIYTAPLCTAMDMGPEGILCSSIEGVGKEFEYVWGEEE